MKKTAETSTPILSEIAERWSPRAYETDYLLTSTELTSILEAGRWAPSASNMQPWRFSVVTRGTELAEEMKEKALAGFNAAWVPNASVTIYVSVPEVTEDGNPYQIAWFDAGLATQNMMLQAQSSGLATHPISGFNSKNASEVLGIAPERIAIAAITVGKRADVETLQGTGAYDRELAPRTRLPLEEIVLHGLN